MAVPALLETDIFMNTASRIVGNHAYFFRDGDSYTVPSAGTASRTSKPSIGDTGWVDFGILSELGVTNSSESREVFAPLPGVLHLYDEIKTKNKLEIKFKTEELSPLGIELLMGATKLTSSSTQYNPLSQQQHKGWLRVEQFDQTDAVLNTIEVFVSVEVSGEVQFNDQIVTEGVVAKVLYSSLNTATL